MSERPRTMSTEQSEQLEHWCKFNSNGKMLIEELRAERAAHDSSEQTIREQCAKIAKEHFNKLANQGRRHQNCGEKIAAAIGSAK